MVGLAAEGTDSKKIMTDAISLEAHRRACSLRTKRGRGRQIARERNTKLHAVTDAKGRPIGLFMSVGPVSDDTGAAALSGDLPTAARRRADRGLTPTG